VCLGQAASAAAVLLAAGSPGKRLALPNARATVPISNTRIIIRTRTRRSRMATDTQASPAPITFHKQVLGIPLVSSSLDTIHSTLSTSPYTKGVYSAGTSLAQSAYDTASRVTTSSSLYPRVLPVITTADGYANAGLDAIRSKFPYPFEASPDQVYTDLKKAPEDARNVAYKTIDERIKTPAYGLAMGVDTRLTPLVDLLESILVRLHARPESSTTSSDPSVDTPGASTSTAAEKAQVTRAKELVFGAKDHIIVLTTEQAKALRNQNVYIQRAADQADALNSTLAAHYASVQSGISSQYQNTQAGIAAYKGKGVELSKGAQEKVHALSQGVIAELEKIQATTASLPTQIQTTFKPLTDEIGTTLLQVKAVVTSQEEPLTMSEKVSKVSEVLKGHIGPIVEKGKEVYATAVDKFLSKKNEATVEVDSLTNGTS
jgi:hypothetical protein